MSLLLEARKKAQQAQTAETGNAASADEPRPEGQPASAEAMQSAREAGQKLFNAKSPATRRAHINPYILHALGGTILLLVAGAGYLWYLDSSTVQVQQRPAAPSQPIQVAPVTEEPQNGESPDAEPAADEIAPEPAPLPEPEPAVEQPPRQKTTVHIEPQRVATVDPLLQNAYLAYRNGKPEEARQLYQAMLAKDGRNTDALLGLAAIAQQDGDNLVATQYFSRVLMLDPRNAVANAGMSALNTEDDGNESRLKTLLREQGDSAALHFALGNLFAAQSRWSEAQQAYFNAWTLDADNAEFAYNLAVSLDHLGQTELATRYYQRAQQLDAARSAGFDHARISRRIEELGRQSR